MQDEIQFLKRVSLFQNLTEGELESIVQDMKVINFRQGDYIIREGERGDSLYVIRQGSVQISRRLTLKVGKDSFEDKDKTLTKLSAHDHSFFGEIGLLELHSRTADVIALTETELFSLSQAEFEKFCQQHPQAGLSIIREIARLLSQRLRKANQDVVKLSTALSMALR